MMPINEKELCYLTDEAMGMLSKLILRGLDPDLAYAMVEKILGETMFNLNDGETSYGDN